MVFFASWRASRLNIVSAIRDLPESKPHNPEAATAFGYLRAALNGLAAFGYIVVSLLALLRFQPLAPVLLAALAFAWVARRGFVARERKTAARRAAPAAAA